jgi:phosphoglycolate phosphatase
LDTAGQLHRLAGSFGILERFQAKWTPVRVKKTRQITNLEPGFDSIETEKALGRERIGAQPRRRNETKPNETKRACTRAFDRYLRVMTCSVLLDLDGTLVDSQPGISASCLAALRALGHEPDETLDIGRAIGPPLEELMQILLQSYGDDRVGEAVIAYRQHYSESGFLGSVPYPGIGKSLEEMKRTGLRIYLATSKRAIFASRILDHLKFTAYFDGVHGSVPGGELDHKPELLAHILSEHGLSPSHSLMVGDRRHDISGAHAVGMCGLGVLWGYGTRDELETAGADRLVDSPADLVRTVLSMVNGKQSPG